jgi:hypothetical protein
LKASYMTDENIKLCNYCGNVRFSKS